MGWVTWGSLYRRKLRLFQIHFQAEQTPTNQPVRLNGTLSGVAVVSPNPAKEIAVQITSKARPIASRSPMDTQKWPMAVTLNVWALRLAPGEFGG